MSTKGITKLGRSEKVNGNIESIAALFEAEREKNLSTWSSYWSEDARVTFGFDPERPSSDLVGKETIVSETSEKFKVRRHSVIDAQIDSIGTGDEVLARVDVTIEFENDQKIKGPIVMIFSFDSEGKISQLIEYFNPSGFTSVK